ncbi:MAG: hypothetical protein ACLQNE_45180 [Thermoguttaceae bacterium]
MCFAIYQSLAEDERRPGLYRAHLPDFFDLNHHRRVPSRER